MSYDSNLTSRFSSVGEIDKLTTIKVGSKDVVEEIATIRGISRKIHRLYAKYENGFQGVGWIIDEDINTCMICDREFGFFLRKHHCRSCGNVVCYICSPDFVVIEEMVELGEQRVCIQCYWGQYPVFASHTRTWEESDEEEEPKVALEIENSFNTYRFQIIKFFEYDGDVIIEKNSNWETIIGRILNDLHILDDYAYGEGKSDQSLEILEEKLQNENIFKCCVLVDEDGEEISPKIDNTKLFWQFAINYSSSSKHSFMLYVNKGKSSYLDIARKGKQLKDDIEKQKSQPIKVVENNNNHNHKPNLIINTTISQPEDSDDSGSDEYDLRINTEHLKLLASKEKTTPIEKTTSSSNINDLNLSFENEADNQNNDLILSLPPISSPIIAKTSTSTTITTSSSLANTIVDNKDSYEYETRRRSVTDVSPLTRPTLVDKHRLEVENILAETSNKKIPSNISNRRVSMTDQKRVFLSFQSTGTISTSNYKKQNRRASTGMGEKKERLSSISKEDAALLALAKKSLRRQVTEEDINLLKVALPPDHLAKIHEWSVNSETNIINSNIPFQDSNNLSNVIEEGEEDVEELENDNKEIILKVNNFQEQKEDLVIEENNTNNNIITVNINTDQTKENELKTYSAIPEIETNGVTNIETEIKTLENSNNIDNDTNNTIHSSKTSPVKKVNEIENENNENQNQNNENNNNNHNINIVENDNIENSTTSINSVVSSNQPIRRKSVKYSLSKEDEELLQLARSSFQINNTLPSSNSSSSSLSSSLNLTSNVTDGETLRLLMTIESSRSVTSNETITPSSKKTIAEKIRKLSPADEALLMLARHSIHPVASDSTILSDYLSKTSELFSNDELKKDNEYIDDDDDIDISPRNDRGSMISLKEIHRNALLDAFETICEVQQDDPSKSIDIAKDGRLSFEKFLSWEQIQNVLSEGILNQDIVNEEFLSLFQNKIEEKEEEEKEKVKLINFDEFCDLMERLENLAEQISDRELNKLEMNEFNDIEQQQSYDQEYEQGQGQGQIDENIGIPTDIKVAYKELLTIESNNNNNDNNDNNESNLIGITLNTILQWNQLLSAIKENLLTVNDVKLIFEKVYNNTNIIEENNTKDEQEIIITKRMSLKQFYDVSLELQRKIDQSIGDLNELDKLTVPIMDEQMRIESLPHSNHPTRPHRRASYRETLGDNLEIYQNNGNNNNNNNNNGNNSRSFKQRNMSIHSTESFESSVQDSFDQPAFNDNEMIESELFKTIVTGHLYKQGGKVKNWKKRKFILKGCRLSYYDTKKLKGEFNTKDCQVEFLSSNECNGSEFGFIITGPGRKLLLYAQNNDDRLMWMEAIKVRIEEYERIKVWEEQLNQMNKYKDDYNQRNSNDGDNNNNNNENENNIGDDDLDERDDSMWNIKHSLNSLRIDPSKDSNNNNSNGSNGNNNSEVEKLLSEGKTIWHQFLDANEILLCTGEIIKRNKFGMSQKRQLILVKEQYSSSTPRLFYVDPSIMKVKGEMEWDEKKAPKAEYVNPTTFKVIVDSRTFNLTIPNTAEKTAQEWVDAINSATSSSSSS